MLKHGLVSFGLDSVKLIFCEVTHGKRVPNTQSVDGLVEHLTAPPGQSAGIHDSGIVITFLLQDQLLIPLIHGALVASQVLDCFGAGHMTNGYFLTSFAGDAKGSWGLGCVHHGRFAIVCKLEMNNMILAFGEFQLLVGCCENVMPQLAVIAGLV